MVFIEVVASIVNANGITREFGDETGTPQFYTVKRVLEKYLGKDIFVSYNNYNDFTFEIVYDEDVTDQGCDISYDFVEIIESIQWPFPDDHYGGRYKGYKLQFEIIYINT